MINVAELFYSIQGEGATSGWPAIFLRLTGCNLLCGGNGTQFDKQLHDGATWRCDTIEVWQKVRRRISGNDLFTEIMNLIPKDIYTPSLPQLVITGGEPLLSMKPELLELIYNYYARAVDGSKIEIETNGTIDPTGKLGEFSSQFRFNVSPKLANSGMSKEIRIQHKALHALNEYQNSIFKFVISSKDDWHEVVEDYILPIGISTEKIYLMPAADNRQLLIDNSLLVAELCKNEGVRYSPRHQVMIWDKTTGV